MPAHGVPQDVGLPWNSESTFYVRVGTLKPVKYTRLSVQGDINIIALLLPTGSQGKGLVFTPEILSHWMSLTPVALQGGSCPLIQMKLREMGPVTLDLSWWPWVNHFTCEVLSHSAHLGHFPWMRAPAGFLKHLQIMELYQIIDSIFIRSFEEYLSQASVPDTKWILSIVCKIGIKIFVP